MKYRISYAYTQLAGNERQLEKDVFWKAINHLKSTHDIYKNFTIEEQKKIALLMPIFAPYVAGHLSVLE